jgi:hypothetical protein
MFSTLCFLLAIACVDARVGDGWGTNIHWTHENVQGEAAQLSKAFRVARMDFNWGSVERVGACGTYNFSSYDTLLSTMEAHGIRPYWILDYGNQCYPSATGTPANACNTAACIAAFGRLAAATAAHFQGHHIIFETPNEPNGMGGDNATDLTALALAAAPGMRATGETFVGPATAGMDFVYIEKAFSSGILTAYTNVSVHPYRAGPPESVLADWGTLAALIANYSGGAPPLSMINGEWGYTSATPPCVYGNKCSPLTQAKYVARMWLVNTLAGVPLSISYDWKDDGQDPTNCEDNFGSVYANTTGDPSQPYTPKPAYLAAVTAQSGVGNAGGFGGVVSPTTLPPGGTVRPQDVFALYFTGYSRGGGAGPTTAIAAWTNATTCAIPQPNGAKTDCGYSGITEGECLARDCCWGGVSPPPPQGVPQCFHGAPLEDPIPVSFPVPPGVPQDACWDSVSVLGEAGGVVCASKGVFTLSLSDGPTYLL